MSDFFKIHGDKIVLLGNSDGIFSRRRVTVEELYQEFKTRIKAELYDLDEKDVKKEC